MARAYPTWITRIGLRLAEDIGNGMGMLLTWFEAAPADHAKQVHYNIYYADTRFNVFSDGPKAITTDTQAVVNISPGNQYYFAVRATEFDPDDFNITELVQIGVGVYQYPESQVLLENIDAYGTIIHVTDNSEYPSKGYLWIGESEVVKYNSKGTNEFYVDAIDRGAFGSFIYTHSAGESVRLWHGVTDDNTYIHPAVAAWHKDNSDGTPRNINELGELNVDDDGYRANNPDIVTTDLSASDTNTIDFPAYDFQGYHRPSLQDTFSGKCTKSYLGGEFWGQRGFNLQDRALSQLDTMLQVTGEPVVLLRRKQVGKRCRCISLQREHPQARCEYCFGTGFEAGYDRYVNPRAISEYYRNIQGKILIRVAPFSDDLKLDPAQGLTQPSELTAWTIVIPTLKDRDVIVRFNEDGSKEFFYEVLDVTRNKLMFSQSGKQEFRLRRLDKTDIVYTFDVDI